MERLLDVLRRCPLLCILFSGSIVVRNYCALSGFLRASAYVNSDAADARWGYCIGATF